MRTDQVQLVDGRARVQLNGESKELEVRELPEPFVRWQLDYKRRIYAGRRYVAPRFDGTQPGEQGSRFYSEG
jgi:hypothetical protein